MARWLKSARLSKMQSCSLPRSIAIRTLRCRESTGVMTRSARASSQSPSVGQTRVHTLQPRQRSALSAAFRFFGRCGSLAETSVIASTGQVVTHFAQPLHSSSWRFGMKFVVCTGCRVPNRRAVISASQQQPQQLQMKPTSVRAFSPNWTITVGLGLLQQIRAFGLIHSARVAVPDERVRRTAERHADVLGRIAGASHMLRLVAAVADAHAHVLGRPDDLAGPLVVQHPQPAVGGRRFRIDLRRCRRERGAPLALRQRRLVDEHAPELRLAAGEQVQDEVVLNRDVLVEQLAQQLLVDVVADAHHRELEEAGHRGGSA